VAAIVPGTHHVASFSSRGPLSGQPGRFHPDLAGCGVDTVMAARDDEAGVWMASGTSMAAPQCAGAATLMRAANPAMSALETKAVLLATTDDISAANPAAPYDTRNAYGLGMVRDDRAVRAALAGSFGTANTATSWSTTVRVEPGRAFAGVVTWHRDPSLGSSWSDLALTLLDDQGQVVASADVPNNLYESIRFESTVGADFTLRVDVPSLQSGLSSQDFAWAFNEVRLPYVDGAIESFGQGCPANGPVLGFGGTPTTQMLFTLRVSNATPGSLVTLVTGYSRTDHWGVPLPLDLGLFGATGCMLYVSPDIFSRIGVRSDGTSFVLIPVPNEPALVGGELFYQLLWDDPSNRLGLSTSNAVRALVGGQR
jgi:hypothetical protein